MGLGLAMRNTSTLGVSPFFDMVGGAAASGRPGDRGCVTCDDLESVKRHIRPSYLRKLSQALEDEIVQDCSSSSF
jgi:hypothetical protein